MRFRSPRSKPPLSWRRSGAAAAILALKMH
jgi:hypothetical protein